MSIALPWLTQDPSDFPDVSTALDEPHGLLAAGGDLSPERLLAAYRRGIFPWYEEGQPILWWCPQPRSVFQLSELKASRSLRKNARNSGFEFSFDRDFKSVIRHCASPRKSPAHHDCDQALDSGNTGTWITKDMISAYDNLHQLGHAHSAECWLDGKLVGGLYGVNIGRVSRTLR